LSLRDYNYWLTLTSHPVAKRTLGPLIKYCEKTGLIVGVWKGLELQAKLRQDNNIIPAWGQKSPA